MASKTYFNYLGSVWEHLPTKDIERMGELWHGYEQVMASVYQNFVEVDVNVVIHDLIPFETERWLPYEFTEDNQILKPAVHTATQDLSVGANLANRYLLRLQVDDGIEFEVDLRGLTPASTQIDEIVSKINMAAGYNLVATVLLNSTLQFTSPTSGPNSKITFLEASLPAKDAIEFVVGIQSIDLPVTVPEYPYIYSSPYESVVSIPELRTKIRDESLDESGLEIFEDENYSVDRSLAEIAFKEAPPEAMWAKRTLFDEETPWHNFGFLMDIYDTNSVQYLNALRGLWFAFWNGPKPENLRKALYLLFTLPSALEDSTVTRVTTTVIETTSDDGVIRLFEIPSGLVSVVTEGQEVEEFQPLVDGIDVFDKTSLPGFVTTEIGRANIQRFLTPDASRGVGDTDETKAMRLLEEHTFLPQINVNAFVTPDINLGNVRTFLDAIQPLHKTYMFQIIVGAFEDQILIDDKLGLDIGIDVTPNVDSNQTTFAETTILDDYETVEDTNLNVDSDGMLFQESVFIEVYSFAILIDSFVA